MSRIGEDGELLETTFQPSAKPEKSEMESEEIEKVGETATFGVTKEKTEISNVVNEKGNVMQAGSNPFEVTQTLAILAGNEQTQTPAEDRTLGFHSKTEAPTTAISTIFANIETMTTESTSGSSRSDKTFDNDSTAFEATGSAIETQANVEHGLTRLTGPEMNPMESSHQSTAGSGSVSALPEESTAISETTTEIRASDDVMNPESESRKGFGKTEANKADGAGNKTGSVKCGSELEQPGKNAIISSSTNKGYDKFNKNSR